MTEASRRPRVLHVIDSIGIDGGAERHLIANLQAFDHDLMEHHVAAIRRASASREDEVGPLAEIHYLIPPDQKPTHFHVIGRLRRLVRDVRPDLLHASLPDSALATRVVARLERIPAVESLVNLSHERVRTIDNQSVTVAKLRFHTVLDRLTMRSLTGFHAVSQAVADSWVETVGLDPAKVKVIPRGTDSDAAESTGTDSAREAVFGEFDLPGDTILAISVGRVEPQKGHRYLIEAMEMLAEDVPKLRLLIVGRPGNASPAVERSIQRARLGGRVRLVGSRRDLPRLLSAADIFVFPSLFEGNGGNAMIEAMISALPIITTNAAPMTDLIPDETVGMLVARCDSAGLAAALRALAEDESIRARLGNAARQRAQGFPTYETIARRHEDWYRELIADSERRASKHP